MVGAVGARLSTISLRGGAPVGFLVGVLVASLIFGAVQLANDPVLFFLTFMRSMGLGSTYALIALGFVLIFKATQTVNFAQGALAATGALFVSFLAVDGNIPFTNLSNPISALGGPGWLRWGLNVIVALAFAAAVGLVIERLAIRPMVGEPLFSVAVITLGLEIIFRVFNNDAVKAEFRQVGVPWLANGFKVGDVLINWSFIAAMITATVVFVAVYFFFRSRLGIAMRAVAFDQEAAMAQGVSVGRVFAVAWAAGAVLAAIGGIFATQPPVAQTLSVDQETANIAFRALPAVILGGLDSVSGALLGGLVVGIAEIYAGQYAAGNISWLGAGYPLIVPYIVMLIGLMVRPYGMFGTPEIQRV
ncbi:MAG: branched-chain amino acid ABC transporter permease [Acidimicrobiaceae bacterium]|nr:branched-chain amino acid ABC transporter permease [Acidimicrobiaceae bacterium]